MSSVVKKCAVYTRKSTEKGLEQDFNTLDAQRESCLAYITSQKSEGWVPLKQLYDDGGYSGGSMDRPALQVLLEDIKAGKINVVVVYKIDRLTRSLADFAKLVEVFDQYGVSFVSVTQSFNTTTSMGRLTLNVLLSFAQFEREVIGERIRDKIAASKKKGMWMGGCPMLGYDIKDRQLLINKDEVETVRYIFDKYLEIPNIPQLKDHLDGRGIKTKSWVARTGRRHEGQSFGRGALHHLLSNPVYAGYIRHKGQRHDGQHQAIISKEQWHQVQENLISRSAVVRGRKNRNVGNVFKGKIFDNEGVLYTPMRAQKQGKQYHYYVNRDRLESRDSLKNVIARLPAHEIETLISGRLISDMKDMEKLAGLLGFEVEAAYKTLEHIGQHAEAVRDLHATVRKVVVSTDRLTVKVCAKGLAKAISVALNIGLTQDYDGKVHTLTIPYHTKRARRGAIMIRGGDGKDPLDLPKSRLESLVKGIIWRDEHFAGMTFGQIAKANNCSRSFVIQLIEKSFQIALNAQ